MDIYQSEKNFLEKIADRIPGLAGYREKEAARDTDKRVREYMARELDLLRRKIEDFKGSLLNMGRLDLVDDVDLLSRKLTRLADAIRYATYGYAGLFDALKYREEELARLYEFDTSLIDYVEKLRERVNQISPSEDPLPIITGLNDTIDALDSTFQKRLQLFTRPGSADGGE